ncbi:MAG: hypothetical protein B9S32_16935 [Verrucomicrobia bacterium Tous-C9LFEB]|nr:MAG: hypothetical protein B9S32_16935 [Verrucomicrobia bacterium Tous-C9LFEB]
MDETHLKIFIKGTTNYFGQIAREAAEIGTPYLKEDNDNVILDYSAVIGISGSYRGCVYYTAPKEMIRKLIIHMGEHNADDALCADFVGEIANTIAGNAQEELGAGFMISVPIVLAGNPGSVRFPKDAPTFVIPIIWQGNKSYLLICVGESITA